MPLQSVSSKFLFICLILIIIEYNQKLYDDSNLTVVFSDDDAIQEYEKQALAKTENLDADKLLTDSLQKLDHVKKLEVLQGKNRKFSLFIGKLNNNLNFKVFMILKNR